MQYELYYNLKYYFAQGNIKEINNVFEDKMNNIDF